MTIRTRLTTFCLTLTIFLTLWPAHAVFAEDVRIATYNVENWRERFQAFKLEKRAATQPNWPQEFLDLIAREKREDEKDNWETQLVFQDPKMNADIVVIQEGPIKADLEYFNKAFLGEMYETIHVFATNTDRGQHTAILLKPGFEVIEIREAYHNEPDKDDVNPISDKLFARGPAFVRVKTPAGHEFWIGTNHLKSKSGNSVEATKWRNAEAVRINQIIKELASTTGLADVYFTGDCNDELGNQEFELEAGGSAMDILGKDLTVVTRKIADEGAISYHGMRRARHRSFIDHIVATESAARRVTKAYVVDVPMARVSSDHFPVVAELKFE